MSQTVLLDAGQVQKAAECLARAIQAHRLPDAPLAIVGIRKRGVPLAERLARTLRAGSDCPIDVGALDITLYRDDLSQIAHNPVLKGTEIPFDVTGKEIVLVDDVLFTGRTVRAALDALVDLGRPRHIRLAALVDRGHRELPIQADYVGHTVQTRFEDQVQVLLQETDGRDEVTLS